MTPEQKIKAVAELDGFKHEEGGDYWYKVVIGELTYGPNNYLTSLDAIVPVIKKCVDDPNINKAGECSWPRISKILKSTNIWNDLEATPTQLTDALLIATGKMKE